MEVSACKLYRELSYECAKNWPNVKNAERHISYEDQERPTLFSRNRELKTKKMRPPTSKEAGGFSLSKPTQVERATGTVQVP